MTVEDPSAGFSEFCSQTSGGGGDTSITISCTGSAVIESLLFACYGDPGGSCGGDSWYYNDCCAANSFSAFDDCVGQTSCTIDPAIFMASLPTRNGAYDDDSKV